MPPVSRVERPHAIQSQLCTFPGSPRADYGTEGVADERASTALAGVAGVAVTAVLAFGLMFALRRRSRGEDEQR